MTRSVSVVLAAWALAGCDDPSARCGAEAPSGACVSVVSVRPTDEALVATNSVDVVRDKCPAPGGMDETDEPFTDHNAVLTISNDPPVSLSSTPERGPAIILERYSIDFKVNSCPGTCPSLAPIDIIGPSVTIHSGEEAQVTVPMVPLRTKAEFMKEKGKADEYPSYSAVYTITGSDPKAAFTITAAAEFTLGDYDNCE